MELNNIIFSCLLLSLGFFLNKFFLYFFNRVKFNLLLDNQFEKPQAFHENSTYRSGGLLIFNLLIFVFLYLFFFKNIIFLEYIYFCTFFFLIGFVDDFKVDIRPKFRLILMFVLLIFLVLYSEIYISKTGLKFLNRLLEIDIFALFFVCLCFLFIINGSNLIDGFNGLLGFHSLIIFIVLFTINLINENYELMLILFYICLVTLIFIKFNFPKAQMFLGDGGAYLIGSLIAISTIKTSIMNPSISPFFFCILLFYLFFEVFFSFFRKLIVAKQSPLFPDNQHLHMNLYKILLKKNKNNFESNYKVSLYINLVYLLLIIPGIFFMKDGLFCRYYFLILLIAYIYFYRIFSKR